MNFNDINLNSASVAAADILQEAVQLSIAEDGGLGTEVINVPVISTNLITSAEGDIVFELIEESTQEKPTEKPFDILDIKIKDEIEDSNLPEVKNQPEMPNLSNFGTQLPSTSNRQGFYQDFSQAYVEIIEQPAANKHRFRYKCEGRAAGSLPGKNAANDNKTFPTIKVMNYQGPAVVVVSCVEDKPPFRAHPHNLVGKNSKRGVFSKEVDEKTMTATFNNLGIQCATRKDAAESLQVRQTNKVDPFKQGFDFNSINSFNLNAVKLCFQCFIRTGPGSRDLYELPAKVSDTIFDAKAYKALTIAEISDNNAPVEGGKKIILLCEKVSRDDIEIRFFYKDPKTGEQKMLKGHFSPNNVHHQVGITFTTPVFPDQSITESIEAQMILYKPSDECVSDPVPFYFTPRNFLEPAVPGAAKNLKRTKEKVKVENNDNNPSDRSLQNPHKKLPSSGGRMLVKTEESGEAEKVEKISFVENYLKNTEHLSKYKNVDINNIPQKELEAIVQTEASSISLRSSEIPKNLDEIVANPQNINLEVFDDLSGQLKDMDVSDQRITRSRTRNSNSTLETPDVSMEQGRSSSSRYNNLNK